MQYCAPMQVAVAILGFSDFERDALSFCIRNALGGPARYELVEALIEAELVVADADAPGVIERIVLAARTPHVVFVGRNEVPGANAVLPRPIDPSRVLRSLDAFHECFGFALTQSRRPTWVARRVWRDDFRLQPLPALEGGPLRLTHKRTDQEHRQARGEAPGGLVRGFSGSVGGTSDGRDYTVTVRLGMQPKAENNPGVTTSHSSAIFCLIEWRAGRNQPPSCGKLRRQLTAPGLLPCGKSSFLFGGADAVSSSKR